MGTVASSQHKLSMPSKKSSSSVHTQDSKAAPIVQKSQSRSVKRPQVPHAVSQPPPAQMSQLKRLWTWYSGEFAFSMLEPWEILLFHMIFAGMAILAFYVASSLFPRHFILLKSKAQYYFLG